MSLIYFDVKKPILHVIIPFKSICGAVPLEASNSIKEKSAKARRYFLLWQPAENDVSSYNVYSIKMDWTASGLGGHFHLEIYFGERLAGY